MKECVNTIYSIFYKKKAINRIKKTKYDKWLHSCKRCFKFIASHLNKTDENQEYDVWSGYGLKALDIMNFYKSIFKGNFKGHIKKFFINFFKAENPINKSKIKI